MRFLCLLIAPAQRRPWSDAESSAVLNCMHHFIQLKKVPNKRDCENCISKSNGVLKDRNWSRVKFFVYNQIQKMMKK